MQFSKVTVSIMSTDSFKNDGIPTVQEDSGSNSNNITSTDTPEFLARPNAMSLKSTTNIDTNPVLSDISVPNKIFIQSRTTNNNATTDSHNSSNGSVDLTKNNILASLSSSKNKAIANSVHIPSIKSQNNDNLSLSIQPKNKALTFTINNDAGLKRSSIYASKSTVTAIPISTNKNNNNYNYPSNEASSMMSRSSSMTTSLSRSFLFGFYHDNRKSKQSNKNVLSKEYWMKDESSRECFTCGKPFTTFRRKHHCRICGQIFCHSCTLVISGEKFGYTGNMRVCYNCFEHANNYEDSSDEDEDITEEQDQIKDHSLIRTAIDNESSRSNETFNNNLDSEATRNQFMKTKQNEVLLLNDDDVQSIMTSGEDSKLFISTPPPPPKMAIPATRQGESLEISFKNNNTNKLLSPNNNYSRGTSNMKKLISPNNHNSYNRDVHTLRDVSILTTPSSSPYRNNRLTTNGDNSYYSTHNYVRNKQSSNKLKRSIFNYVTSSSSISSDNKSPLLSKNDNIYTSSNNDRAKAIIGNLTNKNFKFKFNYRKNVEDAVDDEPVPEHTSEPSPEKAIHNNALEDEGTMSIYSSLNGAVKSDNPIRSTRNSTKSFQRAQASLQRMRSRRKSKSKKNPDNIYRDISLLTHSTPNLLSVVSDNDTSDYALNFSSNIDDEESNNIEKSFILPQQDTLTQSALISGTGSSININNNSNSVSKSTSSSMITISKQNTNKMSTFNQWKRMSSLSGLRYQHGNKNALTEVATLHFEELLIQVLNDQDNKNINKWLTILKGIALSKVQNITLSARDSNTLDYRQKYVKIKRISGGDIEDSEFIDGIVFSKALPCKSMPRFVDNPRILLIMFPLEYQRNENQFLSIESVFAQEREYLNKLITRLTSLHPDIIFVGANVSGYALELLNKEGIVVQFNMKPQVIERIARITEADIAISIDKLASNVKMGECASFEVKTYIYGNISKTYTFLRGCNAALGGTILLRGDIAENLRKIKHVAEFMVYVEFSLKLESSFFNDNFIPLSTEFYIDQKTDRDNYAYTGYFSDFLQKLNSRILTVSPTVEFPIPFLLKRAREIEDDINLKTIEYEAFNDNALDTSNNGIIDLEIKSTLTLNDMKYIIKFIKEREIEDLNLRFQRKSRQWEVSYSLSNNLLGTGSHQSITVLYSMVSTKTATPCIDPQLVTIDYFWDTDISIGQFIENVVSTAWYPCEGGCNGLLFDHYRSYVHGAGKVDVLIEKLQTKLPKLKNIILTWSYCKKCGTSTPILQLSEKTWNYSFGKYLEVMFWSKKGSLSDIGKCEHDFTKDHVKYFGYNDLVVRMEYSDLEIYELLTPPPKIDWKPKVDIKMKVELYYQILDKINTFYASVLDRLDRVKLDTLTDENVLAGEAKIEELKEKVQNEKKELIFDLENEYSNSPADRHLKLNSLLKRLYDNALLWDSEFNSFGKTFLPSETDISRITTKQLKKLFLDANDKIKNHDNDEQKGKVEGTKNDLLGCGSTVKNENNLSEKDNSSPILDGSFPTTIKHSIDKSSGDKDQPDKTVEQLLGDIDYHINSEADIATMQPSDTLKSFIDGNYSVNSNQNSLQSNKVTKLADFFNQMHLDAISKEFELQRELQRRKLDKNKYQGFKLQTSTPIVEVYKDVNDAVDEPLHDNNNIGQSTKDDKIIKGTKNETVTVLESKLNENLKSELENSINQWGKNMTNQNEANSEQFIELNNKRQDSQNSEPLPPVTTTTTASKDDSAHPPEKSLLMKALTNFWADRSAYLWKPLIYPTIASEHVFSDNNVIIREDEPSSLIAFCLNTSDYKTKIIKMELEQSQKKQSEGTSIGRNINESKSSTIPDKNESTFSEKDSQISISEKYDNDLQDTLENSGTSFPKNRVEDDASILESIMTKKTAVHLRYQFEDELTVMSCKIFFTEHFDAFRRICNCGENFTQSLSRCVKWDSTGGKSSSVFLKTLDDRFVIKELSHAELDAFIKFAPSYFEYMAQAMFHDLPTSLAKVFGFYQIQVRNSMSGSKSYKMDIIIMENLFYEKKTTRIFDLKGSMRNRHVEQTGKKNEVLLDENMVEYIYESPIHVREYDKKLLRASLWNDTLFLAKMNVMDYSLVIGIDNDNFNLVVGIIDFIRTFTWDKKLESWVKEKGLVGGGGSSNIVKQPTVVTPRQYKNRFREAMERYILMVPDPWYQETS